MFGITTIEQWWESHSIRSDVSILRRQRRQTRRFENAWTKVQDATKHISEAFEDGRKEKISKAFKEYQKQMKESIDDLTYVFENSKIIFTREVDNLATLETDLRNSSDAHARALLDEAKAMYREVESAVEKLFQEITSFHSVNLTTKKILTESGQAREAQAELIKGRNAIRKVKDIKQVDKDVRNGSITEKDTQTLKNSHKAMTESIKDEMDALAITLLLLQEIESDIEKRRQFVKEKERSRHEGGDSYPHGWAEENLTLLNSLTERVETWLEEEVAEGRIFLSSVEHKRAA
jgi:hypothetical protein